MNRKFKWKPLRETTTKKKDGRKKTVSVGLNLIPPGMRTHSTSLYETTHWNWHTTLVLLDTIKVLRVPTKQRSKTDPPILRSSRPNGTSHSSEGGPRRSHVGTRTASPPRVRRHVLVREWSTGNSWSTNGAEHNRRHVWFYFFYHRRKFLEFSLVLKGSGDVNEIF